MRWILQITNTNSQGLLFHGPVERNDLERDSFEFDFEREASYLASKLDGWESQRPSPREIMYDADVKVGKTYYRFRSNDSAEGNESDEEGYFPDFTLASRRVSAWNSESDDGNVDCIPVFLARNTGASSEKMKRIFSLQLHVLEERYARLKGEYEEAFKNLSSSRKTTSIFMDRNTIQAQIECSEYAEDVLDTCMQLLKLYLQSGLAKQREDVEVFREKCLEIFSFVYKLREDLPNIFNVTQKINDSISVHPITDELYYRKDKVSLAKLLARIAFIQIKEKEAALVLNKEKKTELIHCFKSLFEPVQKEIEYVIQDRELKGQRLFSERGEAKEKRLQKNVGEISDKINEVELRLKLMSFDIPVEEPFTEERLQMGTSESSDWTGDTLDGEGLSESQRQEILSLRRTCAEFHDGYCRAKRNLNISPPSCSFFGGGWIANVEQENGLACVENAELYLTSCNSLIFAYLSKLHLMSDADMRRAWTACINTVEHVEHVMSEVFLVLDAFKRQQRRRIQQRKGCLLSLSSPIDGLILQIDQKKAIFMARVLNIKLTKMEACYKMSLKKYPRSGRRYSTEKEQCLNFFRDRHAEIYDLVEGKDLPGWELLRRVESILQSVRQFEANLWSHVPIIQV